MGPLLAHRRHELPRPVSLGVGTLAQSTDRPSPDPTDHPHAPPPPLDHHSTQTGEPPWPSSRDRRYRLPRTVVPSRYDLVLEPDLAAATFAGTVAIDDRR